MKNKGITLISLVITIVVLIILAGVGISLSIGNNSIFTKAKYAKENYMIAANEEAVMLDDLEEQIENNSNGQNNNTNNNNNNTGTMITDSGEYFFNSLNGFTSIVGTGKAHSLFGLIPQTFETIEGVSNYKYCTYEKELEIPFDLSEDFEISLKNTFQTTTASQMGGFEIKFQKINNENEYEDVINIGFSDAWTAEMTIYTSVTYNGIAIYSNKATSTNLRCSTIGVIGDGENISFYLDNIALGTAEQENLSFNKIVICFYEYTGYTQANKNYLERLYCGDIKYYKDII